GLSLTGELIGRVEKSSLTPVEKEDLLLNLRRKQFQLEKAANLALGLELQIGPGTPDGRPLAVNFPTTDGDVLAAVITAGKPFLLRATIYNGSSTTLEGKNFGLHVPKGWKAEGFLDKPPKIVAAGSSIAATFRVTPPIDAKPTKAYFHRDDPENDA